MDFLQAIFLGAIQGMTEFLPISSSGHLVLFQKLFGQNKPDIFFDLSLHVGTLFAVLIVFREDLFKIIKSLKQVVVLKWNLKQLYEIPEIRMILMVVAGSVPTAIIGFSIGKYAESVFSSTFCVGSMLIITGTFLWYTGKIKISENPLSDIKSLTLKNALIIGFIQGLAVLPGISRSGSTIAAALFLGMNRDVAARFSFFLSIVAILGAEILLLSQPFTTTPVFDKYIVVGVMTSFVVGYLALKVLLRLVRQGKLHLFAPYCWVVGAFTLLYW